VLNKWGEREFLLPLILAVWGVLTAVGVVGPDDNQLLQAIEALAFIVMPAVVYIAARVWQKVSADRNAALVKVEQAKTEAAVSTSGARIKEAEFLMMVEQAKATAKVEVAKSEAKAAIAAAGQPAPPPAG
jgi:hypothetical protein